MDELWMSRGKMSVMLHYFFALMYLFTTIQFRRQTFMLYVGPELKQENRGETKQLLFGGCFAWHSRVETKQETSFEFTFRFT